MDIFPAQYSTLSATALNNFISERYGFVDTTCRLLIRNVSDTYLIETSADKYILKIYRDAHRKLDEIKGEVELLTVLAEKGAKVSYPINDLSGDKIQTFNAIEGTRYGVVFTYAQGKVVNDLDDAQLALLGREMAVVHNITADIALNYNRIKFNAETTISQPVKTIKPAFAELPDEYEYLTNTSEKVIARLNQIDYSNFSYGYCHYDFLPKNFHFDGNEITFFDFDFAGKGYLANDITVLYIHYFLEATYGKISRQETDRAFGVFVENYRAVRPLHDDELKAIQCLGFGFWMFYLGFQYDNFDDWSSIFFGPKFLKDRVALIKKWMDWFGEL
ncbi:MAG: phosphotransferase [Mucilaginibacter sp.]